MARANTASTSGIEWDEPPAQAVRGRGASKDFDAIVAELQANPGRWAIVAKDAKRNVETWKRRGCEVEFRKSGQTETGVVTGTLYARWPKDLDVAPAE